MTRVLTLRTLLLAAPIAFAACDSPLPLPTEEEARKEIEDAEPARRLMLLEANATRSPDNENAHVWLARGYRERKDPRAVDEFNRAIELAPADPVPRIELAYMSIEPDMRRGVDPDPTVLDHAQDLVRPVAGDGATCETRHALVGLYELELSAKRVDPDAEAYIVASIAACTDPTVVAGWKGTLGRVYLAEGKLADAATVSCAAVRAGVLTAANDCANAASGGHPDAFQPASVGEWLSAAQIRQHGGDKEGACAAFQQAVALDAGEDLAAIGEALKCSAKAP